MAKDAPDAADRRADELAAIDAIPERKALVGDSQVFLREARGDCLGTILVPAGQGFEAADLAATAPDEAIRELQQVRAKVRCEKCGREDMAQWSGRSPLGACSYGCRQSQPGSVLR